jgi:hypothetical protein
VLGCLSVCGRKCCPLLPFIPKSTMVPPLTPSNLEDCLHKLKELIPIDTSKQTPAQATEFYLSSLNLLCHLHQDQKLLRRCVLSLLLFRFSEEKWIPYSGVSRKRNRNFPICFWQNWRSVVANSNCKPLSLLIPELFASCSCFEDLRKPMTPPACHRWQSFQPSTPS